MPIPETRTASIYYVTSDNDPVQEIIYRKITCLDHLLQRLGIHALLLTGTRLQIAVKDELLTDYLGYPNKFSDKNSHELTCTVSELPGNEE